jgi:hypothetical protein
VDGQAVPLNDRLAVSRRADRGRSGRRLGRRRLVLQKTAVTIYHMKMVTPMRSPDWDPSHPAPGVLEVVRRFANTLDLYRGRDLLIDVEQAKITLRGLGLLAEGEQLAKGELERVRRVRSAVRSVFIDEEEAPARGLSALEFRIVFLGGVVGIEATNAGLWGRLTDLCVEIVVADRTGALSRLRACANPGCRWLFWDTSRPGTGRWCSMQVCGGQHKARSYRARRKRTS